MRLLTHIKGQEGRCNPATSTEWTASALIQMADSIQDAVLVINGDFTIAYANVSFHQHTGHALPHIVGRRVPLIDRRNPNDFRQFSPNWFRRLQRNGQWQGCLTIQKADGCSESAQVTIFPLVTQHKRQCLVVILRTTHDKISMNVADAGLNSPTDLLSPFH